MHPKDLLPTDASIITTYKCCMKCHMCNIWKYPTDSEKEIKAKELTILPNLKFINVTGGEPFLRHDLDEIIDVCFKKAPRVVISTSGYNVDAINSLAKKFPKIGIRVSIEGLSTINDILRGRKSGFDRGLKTLLSLRKMGIKDIGFGITVSNNNSEDMLELYELAKNMNMEFATASYHNSYYFHKDNNKIINKEKVKNDFYELIDRLLSENKPKSWFRAFFNLGLINYIDENPRLLPCEAGTANFFIEPYGDVYPCNGLEEKYWKESMGNIRDYSSFKELWFSEKAQKVRKLVRTCPKNCWMVGTAAPVMKKNIVHPLKWVINHKIQNMLGKKIDRNYIPKPYNVGQDLSQGNLRQTGKKFEEIIPDDIISNDARYTLPVVSNIEITEDTYMLKLLRKNFVFEPGHHVSIGLHFQYYRNKDYSICSSPQDETMDFLIKIQKNGKTSSALKGVKEGDNVDIIGPYGEFLIKRDDNIKKNIFIASGVGIGPFRAFIKSYSDLDYSVIHGVKYLKDTALRLDIPQENYFSCVSREEGGNYHGRITDYLKTVEIEKQAFYYLCGNPNMIKGVYNILVERGINKENIRTEIYYAY